MSTAISWTNATWNPVVGCTKVSQGCKNCYAKTLHDMRHKALLAGKTGVHPQYAKPFEVVQLMPDRLDYPLHWRKPRRVFVNSVSDLFHEDVPTEYLAQVFAIMGLARQHTFQVLTKRAELMAKIMSDEEFRSLVGAFVSHYAIENSDPHDRRRDDLRATAPDVEGEDWPLPNVWLGTSVENQAAADERIPLLCETPAAVRFLSCEPLLGPLDILKYLGPEFRASYGDSSVPPSQREKPTPELEQAVAQLARAAARQFSGKTFVDWVIIGAESGAKRRGEAEFLTWLASIVGQCRIAGVPPFVKQDSALKSEQRGRIPDDLWIREYPIEVVPV